MSKLLNIAIASITVAVSFIAFNATSTSNSVKAASSCSISSFSDTFTGGFNGTYYGYIGDTDDASFENNKLNITTDPDLSLILEKDGIDLGSTDYGAIQITVEDIYSTPSNTGVIGGIGLNNPTLYGIQIYYVELEGYYFITTQAASISETKMANTIELGTTLQQVDLRIEKSGSTLTTYYRTEGSSKFIKAGSDVTTGYQGTALNPLIYSGAFEEATTATTVFDNFTVGCDTVDKVGPKMINVFRFFNTSNGTHFYTGSTKEKNKVVNNLPDYTYEGVPYKVFDSQGSGMKPVYRFYNQLNGTHFYTASSSEKNKVINSLPQYIYEGVVYYVYGSSKPGTTPVYRFFNTNSGTHFYTGSTKEKNKVVNNNPEMIFEGIVYYAVKV